MRVHRKGFWFAYDFPFGWRVGIGRMFVEGSGVPCWYHLDRWVWFQRYAWEESGGWREGWNIRVLWFYVGRQKASTTERYYDWLNRFD